MDFYNNYQSPFSWRYGSAPMRQIWSETNKRKLWRKIWLAMAEVQAEYGLVSAEQVEDLRVHSAQIDIERALEIEAVIRHDVMAEIKTYAEQCLVGGGVIHLGMTSMDVVDNADALRVQAALRLIDEQVRKSLSLVAEQCERWSETTVMAFTHLQPAEPTTLGYRFANYAQEWYEDWLRLKDMMKSIRGKGLRGAVGTGAALSELVGNDLETGRHIQEKLAERLEIPFFEISTQTYTRKQDYWILSLLAGFGASYYKFAFDLRILQSPPIGEISEPFDKHQVGSSAMPFKRNPIRAEKIDSLARQLAGLPRVAWDNAAHSLLERTLDDSANRRTLLPEAFLLLDEIISEVNKILGGVVVVEEAMERTLAIYAPFAAVERVLMRLVKAGADRQAMHERLRELSMRAWQVVRSGGENLLEGYLVGDDEIRRYLSEEEIRGVMQVGGYVGDAPERARQMARRIRGGLRESGGGGGE